ncbi:phage head-tail connector protein [Lactiplantibacillus plantarum]|uniref:phage head-tail connector protein n=1 Tax=Lactiplantibacillus plantarum TaxID=1590 RepID=UPI0029A9B046|nr:phage head-tail connector protein [Lactiplantibacillus plantarum]MDX3785442.1 phage head-tail connector protein [Lactiplantibacillus plantarum]MDX3811314.1 phage head-tail connector protein [Lactiplantibacillus plantarum]MDX3856494.1 phage head-tail connector protein [Lactiplantibacillus plantarum]
MDILNAVKLRVGIKDEIQDDLLNELINDAKARVLAYINQDGVVNKALPDNVDYIIKEIVVRMYNAIGDEGKAASTEGEVSNTWLKIDLSEWASDLDIYRESFRRRRGGFRFV